MSMRRDRERRDEYRRGEADPISAATPSPSQVQKEAQREAQRETVAQREAQREAPIRGSDPVGYGSNRWGDSPPSSLVSESGDKVPAPRGPSPSDGEKPKPTPEPEKPAEKPVSRSKARGSTLSTSRESERKRSEAKAPAKSDTRKRSDQRDASREKQAFPRNEVSSDRRDAERQTCKPRPKDTRPKSGGGGSGKRFVPWC